MNYKRIGDYIQLVDNRNNDLKINNLKGVSTTKQLIESVANMSGVSLSGYKIVNNNQFVYVADTSRRGDKIAIALNRSIPCIVSSIYTVFEVKDLDFLLPEYLFIWFNRAEFDRYTRFHSWGSARETFNWEDMCDIKIPIPHIDEQKKYVAIYNNLLKNQQVYENSLADLQLICDTYIENLIKTETPKTLGDYIEQSDERNRDKQISGVKGVSIGKMFIKTKANMSGVDISDYKIVKKGYFAFNPNTARMGEKICIALNSSKDCIVSKIYPVFRIKKEVLLLPEYLLLWFSRPEFDRYARFHSWGSARETFDWADMCNVKLPIPDIEAQKAIVTIYHTLETRKRINGKLKDMIKPLCPVLMRGVVENTTTK
ncbi:restriction endonuclease subunit S [Bacteroidales bacterium OttesenSCG-928-A17]|nr:restriction endonuclease subunit S [Bacteroidales bacterium OttesenSCG-928-A17]